MKIDDKMAGHVAPMALEKYLEIVGQRGKFERRDHFGDISAVTSGSYKLGFKDVN